MLELADISRQYSIYTQSYRFVVDYLEIRDRCLKERETAKERELTRENLDEVIPRIKANLILRLANLKAAFPYNLRNN